MSISLFLAVRKSSKRFQNTQKSHMSIFLEAVSAKNLSMRRSHKSMLAEAVLDKTPNKPQNPFQQPAISIFLRAVPRSNQNIKMSEHISRDSRNKQQNNCSSYSTWLNRRCLIFGVLPREKYAHSWLLHLGYFLFGRCALHADPHTCNHPNDRPLRTQSRATSNATLR